MPIDVSLGDNFTSLVVTGPNTGGKTVSLKTVGLLCAMACSGLFIPADENSSVFVFDKIFVDIGDEQSIQESLSTFSSHVVNIVNILNNVTENSLVLVDELGSGTDPIEGACLAISLLETFHNKGALTISTTHYSEIKNYCLTHDGFENASFEFDVENMKPTYHLLVGIPGKSNAFAISKKLGVSDDILNRAKSLLDTPDVNLEEVMKQIYDDRIQIEKMKEETSKNLNQIESLRKSLENRKSNELKNEQEKVEKAKQTAKQILLDAKLEANEIIKELEGLSPNKEDRKKANIIREKLNSDISKLSQNKEKENKVSTYIPKVGDNVWIPTFDKSGIVLSILESKKEAFVQIDSIKTNLPFSKLEPGKQEKISSGKTTTSMAMKSKSVSSEINLIGENVDTAISILEQYLDSCSLSGLKTVRVVHGKGTGKLREGIHKYLKKNPYVKSFRIGTYGEGEMGVTVVTLK